MPTVEQVIIEKRANFIRFLKEIAEKNELIAKQNYKEYMGKLESTSTDEFIYFIATQVQPYYLKNDIDGFINELSLTLFGPEFEPIQQDRIKTGRYLELFVKLINTQ